MSRGKGAIADYKRNMIFPIRRVYNKAYKTWEKQDNPIACGGLAGFSGLVSRDFRLHDFFLGRQNCRNFLHSYFTIEYNTKLPPNHKDHHKIFKDWTDDMREDYRVKWRDKGHVIYLPIIPVLDYLSAERKIDAKYAKKSEEELRDAKMKYAREMPLPFPNIGLRQLNNLKVPIKKRLFKMAHRLTDNINHWGIKWALRVLLLPLVRPLLSLSSTHLVKAIRKDLEMNELIHSGKVKSL